MHQYQVPQFITTESRIIGQITVKQFLYLGGGALSIFLVYQFLSSWRFTIVALFIVVFSLALAFFKPDGQPLASMAAYALFFIIKPRRYIWEQQKKSQRQEKLKATPETPQKSSGRHIPFSKITDLAWNLNIQDHRNQHEEEDHHFSHRMHI